MPSAAPAWHARTERITRPDKGRVFAGVCLGTAEHLGVPVMAVRWVAALSSFLAGAGLYAYVLLWVFTPVESRPDPGDAGDDEARQRTRRSSGVRLVALGILAVLAAVVMSSQQSGWGGSTATTVLIGVGAMVSGLYLAWAYLERLELDRASARRRSRRVLPWLIPISGVLLVVTGAVTLASTQGVQLSSDVLIATAAVLAGIAIVVMPWGVRAWHRFVAEQETRIRETERANIAAHLHDSVLQTLALIQRTDDIARVKVLARAQERELRTWLYGGAQNAPESLAAAAAEAAHEVEELHGVPIDVVVTGDRPLDEASRELVRALREALLNAVRHGAPPVSAYLEVGSRQVEAFVRDHGPGFDLDEIGPDRLGVRGSIIGRMERAGGRARIRRLEDGTEVELTLEVDDPGPVPEARDAAPPAEDRPAEDPPAGPDADPVTDTTKETIP